MPPESLFAARLFSEPAILRFADIAASWLLTYLVHSTLLLLGAVVVTSFSRIGDATRDILWKCALVGGLVTASVQTVVTRAPLGGQLSLAARAAAKAPSAVRMTVRDDVPGGRSRIVVTQRRGSRWTAGFVMLWLTTAGGGLLWLTFGHARTVAALGRRTPLAGTPVGRRLRSLVTGLGRDVELTCSATISSPVALPGNEVCLPRRALVELEATEQDSMLAHEVAHLVRRDPEWLVAARVIEAVLFLQPLNRLARRRMQEVAEYLCDDWAVARTSQPVTLAKCLAAVAEWVGRAPRSGVLGLRPMSAMVEAGGSPLVRRVGRILRARQAPAARTGRVTLVACACALVILAGAAPRVSVANAAPGGGSLTFVGAVERGGVASPVGENVIVLRGGPRVRVTGDSLVRRPIAGAAAGAITARAMVFRTISIDSAGVITTDSVRNAADRDTLLVTWTRRLPTSSPASR